MATHDTNAIVLPEQSLPTGRMVGLGLQHVIAMFGATVLAPFLMGFDPNLAIFFSGIGTLIFMAVVRGRVPSYLGSSFAFIGPVIAAKKLGGVPAALGGIAAAAVVYFIVGALVKTKPGTRAIAALMPPPVTAAVIAVIGIGLAPVGWDMSSKGWPLALFTLARGRLRGRGGPRLRQAHPRPHRGGGGLPRRRGDGPGGLLRGGQGRLDRPPQLRRAHLQLRGRLPDRPGGGHAGGGEPRPREGHLRLHGARPDARGRQHLHGRRRRDLRLGPGRRHRADHLRREHRGHVHHQGVLHPAAPGGGGDGHPAGPGAEVRRLHRLDPRPGDGRDLLPACSA